MVIYYIICILNNELFFVILRYSKKDIMKKSVFIISVLFFASCGIINKIGTFAKCDFKLKSVESITVAGVDVTKIQNFNSLNIIDAAKLTAAYATNSLPLSLTANIFVKNPNPSPASMTKMDWILNIDDTQIVNGILNKKIDVAANNGTATFPISIKADLMKVLSGKSAEAIKSFGFGLADANNKASSRIALKVKPYVTVAGVSLAYPDYFTVASM